jgi:hypothetical protein
MSAWHDIFTVPPEPQVLVWMHRLPPDSAPFRGLRDDTGSGAYLCGENQWIAPRWVIWRWKALPAGQGAPDPSPIHSSGWRDPIDHPPADAQCCWIRRMPFDSPVLVAYFNQAAQQFVGPNTAFVIPWFVVWRWKPHD